MSFIPSFIHILLYPNKRQQQGKFEKEVMRHCPNIVDLITHLYLTASPETEQRIPSSKSFSSKNKKSTRTTKAHSYQISNKKVIKVFSSQHCINSYEFSKIEEGSDQEMRWIKNLAMGEQEHQCRILLCHNYERYQLYELILQIGKQLISNGTVFHLCAQIQTHQLERENIWHNNTSKPITFLSQLKQTINSIKRQGEECQKIWLMCPSFNLGAYPVKGIGSVGAAFDKIQADWLFFQNAGLVPRKMVGLAYKVIVSTILQSISQKIVKRCEKVLDQSLAIKEYITDYALGNKEKFNIKQCQELILEEGDSQGWDKLPRPTTKSITLKQSHTQPFLSLNSTQTRKSSYQTRTNEPLQPQQKQNYEQSSKRAKAKKKSLKIKKESTESSSQESECSQFTPSYKKLHKGKNGQDENMLAQNIHLKWQMDTLKREYDQQSQQYIKKMNQKVNHLKQERSVYLQETAKLRRDNQSLLEELTLVKEQYEAILITRKEYEQKLMKNNQENQAYIEGRLSGQIKKLQQQLINCRGQNQKLQNEVVSLRKCLEDSKLRSKERIRELKEEASSFKQMCEEMKDFCERVQRDFRLQKNRNQNLQKQCHKYQQSMTDLMKISEVGERGNSLIDDSFGLKNSKADPIINLQQSEEMLGEKPLKPKGTDFLPARSGNSLQMKGQQMKRPISNSKNKRKPIRL